MGAYRIADPEPITAEELQRLFLRRETFCILTSTKLLRRTIDKDY
jgi:hypothetical protein